MPLNTTKSYTQIMITAESEILLSSIPMNKEGQFVY